ncbi:hypothetical protein [Methanoplanus endosymbiosus]|uniref:Cobalt transport protein n=1 Tax=Methanoplanus endosymbiosus TaxID=33865 RepID=A0A9E7TKT0_9EURY|nr:hypothetical protein [Methanoplanus endosymbiosus]UUX92955.1 hypothetical protein L6E24_02180 [Methanoplanus endosymbiosus]
MQDARVRFFSVILLSIAAFTGYAGSALAFLWWLLFSERRRSLPELKFFAGIIAMISAISLLMYMQGLNGPEYFVKMAVILLIAFYAWSEFVPGEFLNIMVWLFGSRYGFELGMIAELSLENIRRISYDISKARMALKIKYEKQKIKNIIPVAGNITIQAVRRSYEQAGILAMRGYSHGGSLRPSFKTSGKDIAAMLFSAGFFSISILLGIF